MGYSDPEKQRQYQNEWTRRRRQEWIEENGPCVLCGSEDRLEVHHLDRTFYDGRHVMAYTIWYNPEWKDCIEYKVEARNGTEAKKIATKMRKAHEQAAATLLQKVVTG